MRTLIATILATLTLAACSGSDSTPISENRAGTLTLTQTSAQATKDNLIPNDANVIDLFTSGLWTDWDGNPVQVTTNPSAVEGEDNVLLINSHSGGAVTLTRILVLEPLTAGATYTLDVGTNADPSTAALIFPFTDVSRQNGREIVDVSGDMDFAMARPGQPFSFVAPPLIKGFWVQFQTAYLAEGSTANLDPRLGITESPVAQTNPNVSLIDFDNVPFTKWFRVNEVQTSVTVAPDGEITIDPTLMNDGSTARSLQGVMFHYDEPLRGEYELRIYDANSPGILVMVFGLDASGEVKYDTSANGLNTAYVGVFSESAVASGARTIVKGNHNGFALMVQPALPIYFGLELPALTKFKVSLKPIFN